VFCPYDARRAAEAGLAPRDWFGALRAERRVARSSAHSGYLRFRSLDPERRRVRPPPPVPLRWFVFVAPLGRFGCLAFFRGCWCCWKSSCAVPASRACRAGRDIRPTQGAPV